MFRLVVALGAVTLASAFTTRNTRTSKLSSRFIALEADSSQGNGRVERMPADFGKAFLRDVMSPGEPVPIHSSRDVEASELTVDMRRSSEAPWRVGIRDEKALLLASYLERCAPVL